MRLEEGFETFTLGDKFLKLSATIDGCVKVSVCRIELDEKLNENVVEDSNFLVMKPEDLNGIKKFFKTALDTRLSKWNT